MQRAGTSARTIAPPRPSMTPPERLASARNSSISGRSPRSSRSSRSTCAEAPLGRRRSSEDCEQPLPVGSAVSRRPRPQPLLGVPLAGRPRAGSLGRGTEPRAARPRAGRFGFRRPRRAPRSSRRQETAPAAAAHSSNPAWSPSRDHSTMTLPFSAMRRLAAAGSRAAAAWSPSPGCHLASRATVQVHTRQGVHVLLRRVADAQRAPMSALGARLAR